MFIYKRTFTRQHSCEDTFRHIGRDVRTLRQQLIERLTKLSNAQINNVKNITFTVHGIFIGMYNAYHVSAALNK